MEDSEEDCHTLCYTRSCLYIIVDSRIHYTGYWEPDCRFFLLFFLTNMGFNSPPSATIIFCTIMKHSSHRGAPLTTLSIWIDLGLVAMTGLVVVLAGIFVQIRVGILPRSRSSLIGTDTIFDYHHSLLNL